MAAIDPVCGMEVEESTAQWKSDYQGQTYYFCSANCKRDFDQEPKLYLPEEGQANLNANPNMPMGGPGR